MIKKNRAGLTLIAISLIAITIALGLSWRDSFWMSISFCVVAILLSVLALRIKNRIVGGYLAFLMIASCLFVLDSSGIVQFLIWSLVVVASIFGFWIGVFGAIFYGEYKDQCRLITGLSLLCLPVLLVNIFVQAFVENTAYSARVDSLLPLVRGIEKFQHQKGIAPKSLAALVPEYIERIPTSELRKQSISYRVLDGALQWQLTANCTNGIRAFYTIFYRPTHDYSDYSLLGREIGHGFFVDYSGP